MPFFIYQYVINSQGLQLSGKLLYSSSKMKFSNVGLSNVINIFGKYNFLNCKSSGDQRERKKKEGFMKKIYWS